MLSQKHKSLRTKNSARPDVFCQTAALASIHMHTHTSKTDTSALTQWVTRDQTDEAGCTDVCSRSTLRGIKRCYAEVSWRSASHSCPPAQQRILSRPQSPHGRHRACWGPRLCSETDLFDRGNLEQTCREEKERGGCMVSHFRERRTDAARRRGASCVERREYSSRWVRGRACAYRRLALTESPKELQCFSPWRHTQREEGRESYSEWRCEDAT